VEEMMHVMERHNKLEPENCFGKNVNSHRLLICANAGNPTIRECVKTLAGDLDRLFASAMGTWGHSSSSVEIHLMERTLGGRAWYGVKHLQRGESSGRQIGQLGRWELPNVKERIAHPVACNKWSEVTGYFFWSGG